MEKRLDHLVLGKITDYAQHYDASLLQGVPRSLSRDSINLPSVLPFTGTDTWNAYEVSWLNAKGKPVVAILQCDVPINSENLIESKSFKLYLNSFNQTRFESKEEVLRLLQQDLSACAGRPVELILVNSSEFASIAIGDLPSRIDKAYPATVIDDLDITIDDYNLSAASLVTSNLEVSETLISHLLKSNCLITNQPDWGSIQIKYSGKQLDKESVLRYLISFRQHNEFHEQCVERIFYDILTHCKPKKLSVCARYTRRGGLDINPFRTNFEAPYDNVRLARQ
ncbi:MAG: 7-cyano-7-deazaguanine reductase [Alphaproteobacteria bacterium]|jgi:7-cyano-7-deazaguanine reductase